MLAFCSTFSLQAQDIITYNTTQSAGTKEACKGFSLKPGFSFKAATGSSMTLRVNTAACSAETSTTAIPSSQNYVITLTPLGQTKSVTYKDGTITVDRTIEGDVNVLTQIQYFDGLGRPIQTVQKGITPAKSDLVTYQEYDPLGREERSWLPSVGAGNNGAFMTLANVKTKANATYGDSVAYSKPVYEASPLNRILQQYGPGAAWKASGSVKTSYLTNLATGDAKLICSLFTVDGAGLTTKVKRSGNYAANELYVTELKDEMDNLSYEFKDKLGQVVLTRQIENNVNLDTYYVYDDFGNLCFVLPPMASEILITGTGSWDNTNATCIAQYSYIYRYDGRNRCVHKKLPGADWIYYVYDKADRLIFTQDGEQRTKGEWLFSIPDALGRVTLSGICKTVNAANITVGRFDKNLIKAEFSATGTQKGYNLKVDDTALTLGTSSILTVNYYDTYTYQTFTDIKALGLGYTTQSGYGTQYASSKGLLTGSITSLLDGSNKFLYTAMYYDYKGNVIQSKSTNHLDGVESEYIAYTFAGSPTQKLHTHTAKINNITTQQTELYTYAYDHAGRLLTTKHKLNTAAEVLLAQNTYDELGRLSTNTANNQAALKNTYAYNIRSWTNSITNTHFIEKLTYNLNGNIATQNWLQANKNRTYTFAYDNLSRIKSATYTNTAFPSEKFAENMTYDKMGNIKTVLREGLTGEATYGTIDNLTFGYTGNQLLYITDAGPNVNLAASADFKDYSKVTTAEYAFNTNGAMTKDLNKGISQIQYNSLNLPLLMDIKSPVAEARNEYIYTATGTKLKVLKKWNPNYSTTPVIGTTINPSLLTLNETTDYVGNKVYENGTLKRILTDNGYIESGIYYFYIKDHLGNNRIVANASAGVIQSTQFYPFGMAFAEGTTTEQGRQPYKYNGKELDQSHGLNQYDYSARFYDPAYNRFTTMDPLSEKYYSWSPYVYVGNNPMKYIDPTGMAVEDVEGGTRYTGTDAQTMFSKVKDSFSISNHVREFFGLNDDPQNVEKHEQTKARLKNTKENIETANNYLSIIVPGGSVGGLIGGIQNGDANTVWAAVPFIVLDLATLGKGNASKNLVKIVEKESDVIIFSSKIGEEIVEGISNFLVKDGKLYLNQLHLAGSSGGKVGRSALWEMAKDLGRQHNVQEVIIQGGKRTTGKYKGTIPSPIKIKVD